ncbi:hypothetical protein HK101_000274 [Irineochytrium annulatum]|nr:hypothetical protein HK101_000274 [Irineochytrium annulatum]
MRYDVAFLANSSCAECGSSHFALLCYIDTTFVQSTVPLTFYHLPPTPDLRAKRAYIPYLRLRRTNFPSTPPSAPLSQLESNQFSGPLPDLRNCTQLNTNVALDAGAAFCIDYLDVSNFVDAQPDYYKNVIAGYKVCEGATKTYAPVTTTSTVGSPSTTGATTSALSTTTSIAVSSVTSSASSAATSTTSSITSTTTTSTASTASTPPATTSTVQAYTATSTTALATAVSYSNEVSTVGSTKTAGYFAPATSTAEAVATAPAIATTTAAGAAGMYGEGEGRSGPAYTPGLMQQCKGRK